MKPVASDTEYSVLAVFVKAVTIAFGDEPFEDIEAFLERAWVHCRLENDPIWLNVRDQIRADWPTRTDASSQLKDGNAPARISLLVLRQIRPNVSDHHAD